MDAASSRRAESIGEGVTASFRRKGFSGDEILECELARSSKRRAKGWIDKGCELACAGDAGIFEEAKASTVGEREQADVYSPTNMSGRRRTVAHVSCIYSADRLSVKSRHWVVVGRHRLTTARCIVQRQNLGLPAGGRRRACRSSLGLELTKRWGRALPVVGASILGIELDQVAVPRLWSSRACCSRPSG